MHLFNWSLFGARDAVEGRRQFRTRMVSMVKNTRHGFLFVYSSVLIWFCRRHPCCFLPATIMSRAFVLRALWVHQVIRYNRRTIPRYRQPVPSQLLLCSFLLRAVRVATIFSTRYPESRLVEPLLVTPTCAYLPFVAAFLIRCSPPILNSHLIVFRTSSSSFDVPTPDTPISPLAFVPPFVQLSTLASVLRSLDWALTLARLSVASSAK